MIIPPAGKTPERELIEEQYAEIESLKQQLAESEAELAALRAKLFTSGDRCMSMKDRIFTLEGDGFILDNNFDFDAALKVSGDFVNDEKNQYSKMIINVLNAHKIGEE